MNLLNQLSVIIITKNEERDIEDCLKSAKGLAGEIVIVDSGSGDRTLEICKRYTDQIYHRDWTGYSDQKQFALEKAKGPWILNIDSDERISPQLADEMRTVLLEDQEDNANDGYAIPFQHYFLGKRLRFGGAYGETHARLFKKEKARYGQDKIHEGIHIDGIIGKLSYPIHHYSYHSIDEYLEKCNEYTSLIAEKKFAKGERFHFWNHFRLPYEFVVRYFLKLGFLDGSKGLVYAILSSYYFWLKYLKLLDLERSQN
ncbi:hypothetical protein BVX98_02715 [bacterium F11]|nr:hypothetical protein BVX98_02715 [bacterium F11]